MTKLKCCLLFHLIFDHFPWLYTVLQIRPNTVCLFFTSSYDVTLNVRSSDRCLLDKYIRISHTHYNHCKNISEHSSWILVTIWPNIALKWLSAFVTDNISLHCCITCLIDLCGYDVNGLLSVLSAELSAAGTFFIRANKYCTRSRHSDWMMYLVTSAQPLRL